MLRISCIWWNLDYFVWILGFERAALLTLEWTVDKCDLLLIQSSEIYVVVIVYVPNILAKPVVLAVTCYRCLSALLACLALLEDRGRCLSTWLRS